MKGSSLRNFILFVVSAAVVVFVYVAALNEIKNLNKVRLNKTEQVSAIHNRIGTKTVMIQQLTSEDRIVRMAIDSLQMKRSTENIEVILVSKDQIIQIKKILKEKYDK